MALNAQLATGTVTTTSAAVITVPAGQLWKVQAITIQQPQSAVAKTFSVGTGTQATAANVKLSRAILAGQYSEVIHVPFTLAAAATLDMIVSAGTTELTYTVQGTKELVA